MASNNFLPATFEGRWTRLRPVARGDFPWLYGQRFSLDEVARYRQTRMIPTFDHWERGELAEWLASGPTFIVENGEGNPCGSARLCQIETRDSRCQLDIRIALGAAEEILREALHAMLDYTFAQLDMRKVYIECISANAMLAERLVKLGFVEEVRLRHSVSARGRLEDIIYFSLSRREWNRRRLDSAFLLDVSFTAEDLITSS